MNYLKTIQIFSFLFCMHNVICAQDLSIHRWEQRILIINFEDFSTDLYETQLNLLRKNEAGLKERKLIIYQKKGTTYRTGILANGEWLSINNEDFQQLRINKDSNFEVILIGLDGGIKRRQNSVLAMEDLFSLIDGMPMRIRELKNKRN